MHFKILLVVDNKCKYKAKTNFPCDLYINITIKKREYEIYHIAENDQKMIYVLFISMNRLPTMFL